MRPMPLAPSYCFQLARRSPHGGIDINLNRIADGATKRFYVASARSEEPYISHMESLTESQCDQFLAEKKAIVKEKKEKKPPPEKKEEEPPESIKDSFKSFVDGKWVKVFKD